MNTKSIFVVASLSVAISAQAGVFRHDKQEKEYEELAAQPQFNCVGQLYDGSCAKGSCVLVGGRYILSAAHCFVESDRRKDTLHSGNQTIVIYKPINKHFASASGYHVVFNNKSYQCKSLITYPGCLDTATHDALDIALLELEEEVKDVTPANMNSHTDELNAKVTGVGFGGAIPANMKSGPEATAKKFGGENVADSIGGYKLNNMPVVMYMDLDHPTDASCNKTGEAHALPLEFLFSSGDSGGGLFRKTETRWELVGICASVSMNFDQMMRTGYYGQTMACTRIAPFQTWIAAHIK